VCSMHELAYNACMSHTVCDIHTVHTQPTTYTPIAIYSPTVTMHHLPGCPSALARCNFSHLSQHKQGASKAFKHPP